MDHIPVWVFVIFFVLLSMGIKWCGTQTISVSRLILLPAILIFFSVKSMFSLLAGGPSLFVTLSFGGVIGAIVGFLIASPKAIRADKQKQLIEIPGDVSVLVVLISMFCIEFFLHYAVEAHMELATTSAFASIMSVVIGCALGVSVGRSLTYFSKYTVADSIALEETK